MKKNLIYLTLSLLFVCQNIFAQTTLSGKITDKETNEALIGANIVVKGSVSGTTSDTEGNFKLQTSIPLPFKLLVSVVGYASQEVEITQSGQAVDIKLTSEAIMGEEVVVSASRVEEKIMQSPVTVEKLDLIAVQQSTTPDFYDAIGKIKGVQPVSGSLTMTSYNTRGFATIANTRFVQLIDGMDNSAPTLNFPTGNLLGISELDVESVDLMPGAASALYGPNAFNGLLIMNSKNPFEYQGLSVQAKTGATSSTASGAKPYYNVAVRYAKSFFNDRLAFKANFSYLKAEDWYANNYTGDRVNPNNTPNSPNFDGMNTYGDETAIRVPFTALASPVSQALLANPAFANQVLPLFGGNQTLARAAIGQAIGRLGLLDVRRTGLKEDDIVDNHNATTLKWDAALHYKVNDKMTLSYNYRYGTGNAIYQGAERYALRNISQQFHKLELKGANFFVRAYMSQTGVGNSYNMSALGGFANESFSPTSTQWLPTYAGTYVGAVFSQPGVLQGLLQGNTLPSDAIVAAAHQVARTAADASTPKAGTPAYNEVIRVTREERYFKRRQPGARFLDDSRLWHAEFNYNFSNQIKIFDLQIGGNVRRYDLFTENTILNEDPDGDGVNERIVIDEYGFYAQISKRFIEDRLKITASSRYDKNQNFDGQFTPRVSVVYSAGQTKQHNFRASFQTGFRNPDTQAQFIYFPSSTGTLLGSTKANAERYGIFNGGAVDSKGNTVNIGYIQPEQLKAYEIGYKGVIANKLMLDLNAYYNEYTNFIAGQTVFSKVATTQSGVTIPAGTAFRPYVNSPVALNSMGVGVGLTYNLPKNYVFSGNYSYDSYTANLPAGSEFEPQFNTPKNKINVSLSNRNFYKNLGFNINYRWQEAYLWQSSFGAGMIEAYGVLDAQLSYKSKPMKSIFKLGASNLTGQEYITNYGGPNVGALYYFAVTFDQFLN
ncbi:MAG: TonB-dependent receptor [Bacteroidetes bacterium]|nr:MAG: TonB-dependent receptor [Bacteroidota bacterium]